MSKGTKAIPYVRERAEDGGHVPYTEKFADFIRTVAQAQASGCDAIMIAEPWVIGDTYEEVIESLSQLGGTGVGLHVATSGKASWNN